ncbi:MAG: phosphatase PAP2 family protein [Candidatus Omnitrophica bacterium]|nr:phosphatase PAP2 family protein [Candidatus Omnitrophota bacterium]
MQNLDEMIVLFFQSLRCEPLTLFFSVFIPYELWSVIAVALVLFSYYKTKVLRFPVISFFLAGVMSRFSYEIIKGFIQRPRPFRTIEGAIPLLSVDGFSCPSGHATMAVTAAVVLGHHFPNFRKPVYGVALMIVLSRVYFGVHYLSDVLAGMVLGAILGWLCIIAERAILLVIAGVDLRKVDILKLLFRG